ncbi:DUF423 domain-containing protein [Pseudochryseolinea flava]|uniref:DUF423 domain-containing protein n=1 Tax=Pseudochryseolinea flava TaxID=2059302 RepID=A0A364XYV4_9BACT|nr:DUF423 domain-containing protein [Pseudochryseolinea flava]RAV98775.1 DUF423 domain-containing protein [Pseudochryseolinea flava]
MNQRITLAAAAILGLTAVVLGASGAHGFKAQLAANQTTEMFELANRYHFFHVFALLTTGILMNNFNANRLGYAALFFVLGVVCFSGSLYTMSFVKIGGGFGLITPIGGLLLIVAWLLMLLSLFNTNKR